MFSESIFCKMELTRLNGIMEIFLESLLSYHLKHNEDRMNPWRRSRVWTDGEERGWHVGLTKRSDERQENSQRMAQRIHVMRHKDISGCSVPSLINLYENLSDTIKMHPLSSLILLFILEISTGFINIIFVLFSHSFIR